MKYAITGNKGLIGTSLKERFDKDGHECVMQIDKKEGFDICDLMFKEYELSKPIDVFLHFCAQCRINEAIARPILPHKNNVDGILAVLEFCKKHEIPKVVVASSSRVLSPERNPYVASKVYVEELTRAYTDCYGLEHIIVRPSTVYGPMQDETSRLMNNWITAAFKGAPLRLYGNRDKTLGFTYVSDFVDATALTLEHPWNKTYNISGEETKLIEVADEIIRQVRSKSSIEFLSPEKSQPQQVNVDTSGIRNLGWKPKVDIKEGIKKMVNWYRDNPKTIFTYKDKGRKFYGRE